MTRNSNYYQLLGVDYQASTEDIRQAYRRLAMKYHPDINHSVISSEIFASVTEAYQVLSDENNKKHYDLFVLKNRFPVIAHELTSVDVYKKVILLRKETIGMDIYRMDKPALALKLEALLNKHNLKLIFENQSHASLAGDFVEEVWGILHLLSYEDRIAFTRKLLVAGADKTKCQYFIRQQRFLHFVDTSKGVFAVLLTILLTIIVSIFKR